jgi:hypothetical protein
MNKLFYLLLLVLLVPFVSAYSVNQPVVIDALLQDDSSGLVSLSNASCLISIYFFGTNSFVVHDAYMTAGVPYQYVYVPSVAGDYRSSILCSYLNEYVSYFEDFSVTAVSGSNVTVTNRGVSGVASISVPQDSYTISAGSVSIPVSYYLNGVQSLSPVSKWELLRDGNTLDSGVFVLNGKDYVFNYDFSNMPTGEYQVFMVFDGVTRGVDLSLRPATQNFITGLVVDETTGEVVTFRVVVLFFIFLLILLVLWLLLRRRKKDEVVRPVSRSPRIA